MLTKQVYKENKVFLTLSSSLLRPVAVFCALVGLAAYAALMLRGSQGLNALEEKRRMVRELEDQNATLMKQINQHKRLIDKLQHDPGTQERYVRERTGKTRPGNTSFLVLDQPAKHQ
jgi:cell division protein FtsB